MDEHYAGELARIEQQETDRVVGYLQGAARGASSATAREAALRRQALSAYAGYRQLPRAYAEEIDRRAGGWLHTPVVVISWNGDRKSIGGHNLDAKVTKVIASEAAPVGQPRIDRLGNVIINPRDVPRAHGLIRPAGRNYRLSPAELEALLRESLGRAASAEPRSRPVALHLPAPPGKPPIGRPPISNGGGTDSPGEGFGWWGEQPPALLPIAGDFRQRREETPNLIELSHRNGRFELRHSEHGPALMALTYEDAVDALSNIIHALPEQDQPTIISFDGIQDQKAVALTALLQARSDSEGYRHEIIGLKRGEGGLEGDYDFARGEIRISELEQLPSGEWQRTVLLEAPSRRAGLLSLVIESRLIFNSLFSRAGIEAVTQRVARAFQGLIRQFRGQYQSRQFQYQMALLARM